MGLEAILQAIHTSGEAQVAQIEAHTTVQIEAILTQTRQEANRVKAKAYNNAVSPAAKERSRILHQARLEALYITGHHLESLIDAALESARRYLTDLRTQPNYRDVLSRLTLEALAEIRLSCGKDYNPCLQIDPRDRVIIDEILSSEQMNLPVQESLNCWGGLVVKSTDDCVVIINTLEARLQRATPFLRRGLARFFENKQGPQPKECQDSITAMPACAP